MNDTKKESSIDIIASWIARRGLSSTLKSAIDRGLTGIRLILKGDIFCVSKEVLSFSNEVKSYAPNVKIMIDLPGSKPRLGKVNEKVTVKQGQLVYLHKNGYAQIRDNNHLCVEGLTEYWNCLNVNDRLFINDNETVFIIKEIDDETISIQLISNDTSIISYRSISLPDCDIHYHGMTNYDIQALHSLAGDKTVDSVALSMVTKCEEVQYGREIINKIIGDVEVIAKIETPEALCNISSICESADTVMIARGDMRNMCNPENLFYNQQIVINAAKRHKTSIIVATGILASLGTSLEPSISELNDVGFFISNGISRFLIADAELTLNHPERACEWIKKIKAKNDEVLSWNTVY